MNDNRPEPSNCADVHDRATLEEQRELERNLARHRAAAQQQSRLQPKGYCHYCDEPLNEGQLFCDKHCSDDFEYEQSRRAINKKV